MALFQRIKTPLAEMGFEGEVPLPAGPRSAGDALRQQREALGLNFSDVAGALRIKPAYLAAIEEGRPDRLPGPAYAAGFVRAYGDHLGLDGAEILRRFRLEAAGLDAKPDLSFPMPLGERSVPGRAMLLLALILAICGYGAWYYLSTDELARPERVTEVPATLLPPKPRQNLRLRRRRLRLRQLPRRQPPGRPALRRRNPYQAPRCRLQARRRRRQAGLLRLLLRRSPAFQRRLPPPFRQPLPLLPPCRTFRAPAQMRRQALCSKRRAGRRRPMVPPMGRRELFCGPPPTVGFRYAIPTTRCYSPVC